MSLFRNVLASFIGGIFIGNQLKLSIIIRSIVYFIILIFFEIFFYVCPSIEANSDENNNLETANLIATGILTFFIFIIKMTLWILNVIIKSADEISDSDDFKREERPDNISPEIWQLRETIIKSKRSQDLVISDLLASGVDSNGLMNLINYIQRSDGNSDLSVSKLDDEKEFVIILCGKSYYTKLNPESINTLFPSDSSIFVVLLSTLLCFFSTYLSLSIRNNIPFYEKWWDAIVCAISIYSILYPLDSDPYSTKVPDHWTGCSRPLALIIITGLWRLVMHFDDIYFAHKNPFKRPDFSISFFYDVSIKWEYISPYLNDVFHYSFVLLPFLVFVGLIGHPLSFIMSIFESFNRYLFGQNGISDLTHLIIQLIRGAASVAISWVLLNYRFSGLNLAASITISTLLATFPIVFNLKKSISKIIFFSYPFLLSALSFIISFCIVHLTGNRWDYISWTSFGWIFFTDVLLPYFSSNEKYFFFHFKLFHAFSGSILLRNITQLIITPLFISSALHYNNKYIHKSYDDNIYKENSYESADILYTSKSLPILIIAFAIVHGIQKANSEPHIFAFAIWLTVFTLPYEFNLQFPAANFIISLLIVAKLEIFIPQAEFAFNSRNASFLFKNEGNRPNFLVSILIQIFIRFFQMVPMPDLLLKIPSLIWSFITGASFISIKGISALLSFSPIRPTYFFDFPVRDDHEYDSIFSKKVGECPIEGPVYESVTNSLSSKLATVIRSGRLGLVSNGDIFLMQESASLLTVIVHIIAIEPYCIKMQIRGLEYTDRTLCHAEEDLFLFELINGYSRFPNIYASSVSSCSAYDIRALGIPFKAYECSKTNIQDAFIGLEPSLNVKIMLVSYCHVFRCLISRRNINVQEDIQSLPNEIAESEKVQLFHSKENLEYITELLQECCSLDDEEINLLFDFFVMICISVLDEAGNFIKTKDDSKSNDSSSLNVVNFFNGNFDFCEDFSWIYDVPSLFSEFVLPTIRIGIVSSFLASSGLIDNDESIQDISDFIDEVCRTYTITTVSSPAFRAAFNGSESYPDDSASSSTSLSTSFSSNESAKENLKNENFENFGKRKKIITLGKIKNEDVIIRFSKNRVRWNVLKIKREWVRALWGNDTADILFYGNSNSERISIQYNKLFLNNMILQACDSPIGYPAYVSKIVDSFIHTASLRNS